VPIAATEPEPVAQVTAESVDDSDDEPAGSTGEPYIETTRCTTCDECTEINGRMFAYDDNKQAYIADPDAGTYRDLVEAAESCQVAIIFPGNPKNTAEPGLDELIARAAPFR
jgi:ferredoxin